jgi:hypothetical protein
MKKLIGFGIFCLVIGVLLLFDFGRSKLFAIGLVGVNPDPILADGNTRVTVTARLTTRGGKPVQGHDLFILSLDGGLFTTYRSRTDAAGIASFEYFPYQTSTTYPLHDIRFEIRDESNSVFLEVNTKEIFTVKAVEADTAIESKFNMEDIFGK